MRTAGGCGARCTPSRARRPARPGVGGGGGAPRGAARVGARSCRPALLCCHVAGPRRRQRAQGARGAHVPPPQQRAHGARVARGRAAPRGCDPSARRCWSKKRNSLLLLPPPPPLLLLLTVACRAALVQAHPAPPPPPPPARARDAVPRAGGIRLRRRRCCGRRAGTVGGSLASRRSWRSSWPTRAPLWKRRALLESHRVFANLEF
eukprot:gene13963-biopygen535